MIQFKKVFNHNFPAPSRANPSDAGLDICCIEDFKIYPEEVILVHTGWSCSFPSDMYLRVAPRSGLAVKHRINTLAGVIDSGYRGEIIVVLHKIIENSSSPTLFKAGDKIAQLIPTSLALYESEVVDEFTENGICDRGGGFGSTGR